ncbi:hypothetical protein LINPERHAP1_LOCUS22903 [Linum perenne]
MASSKSRMWPTPFILTILRTKRITNG